MDRADMTHPLTPREKVARIIDPKAYDAFDRVSEYQSRPQEEAPWSKFWADLCWYAKNETDAALNKADAILTVLASGSGDHADLARLARKAREQMTCEATTDALCDGVEALLAENAALRAQNDVLEVERIGLRSAIFGSPDYDPSLRHGNFIEMARATEDARQGALARSTEAERKLAEAVGHVEQLVDRLHSIRDSSIVLIAARTYLSSKEAERG